MDSDRDTAATEDDRVDVDGGRLQDRPDHVLGELVEGEQLAFGRGRKMNACCRTCLCSCVPRPRPSSEIIATPPPAAASVAVEEVRARIIVVLRQREPFEGAAAARRCSSTRTTAAPPATRSASAPGAPDAAVLRFDLAPDADLRLLDSSMPATVASAGVF